MIVKIISLFKLLMYQMPILLLYLICFIVTYIIYINYMKIRKDAREKNPFHNFEILKQIDYIYIKNIKIEILKLSLLILSTIGLITLLRVLNFGKTYTFWDLLIYKTKNAPNFMLLFILLTIMYTYMKMFNIILKDTFYKIHLYFYGNKIYFYFIDLIWWKGNNTFSIITKVHLYLNRLFNNNKLNSSENNFSSRLLIYLEKKIKINNKLNIILNLLFK